jgi:pimeloyl-ACP methyl ester carboxylesterase
MAPSQLIVILSEEDMKSIQAKVLVLLGDQDLSIPLESVAMARKNVSDFYLWILPNSGHTAHEGQNKDEFVRVSKLFFSGKWNQ